MRDWDQFSHTAGELLWQNKRVTIPMVRTRVHYFAHYVINGVVQEDFDTFLSNPV